MSGFSAFSVIFLIVLLLPFKLAHTSSAVAIPICRIQGSKLSSSFQGWMVQIQGVVTADFDQSSERGFYVQSENCDANPSTSDGIFVYLAERVDLVSAGDRVQVVGLVQEYYGMTEIQAVPQDVIVISHANPLPQPIDLAPPVDNSQARLYFESLESMFVRLDQGRVVGPTDSDDRTWLVRSDLGLDRVFYDDPAGTGEVICVDDQGLFEISPEARVGDQVQSLEGVLDFRLAVYCVQLTSAPVLLPAVPAQPAASRPSAGSPRFRLATFNLAELFDVNDDPLTQDQVLSKTEYQRRLQKRVLTISQELQYPELLAVQEAENAAVLEDLVALPEMRIPYRALIEDGPDVRGLDVALLYRPDLVEVLEWRTYQGCTGLVDGFEPDGNDDPQNPQNELTCDRNGDGVLDGNRLFSRPPLAARLRLRPLEADGHAEPGLAAAEDFWVIVCHWKSKVEDTSTVEYTLPRRIEQAQFVANLAAQIHQAYPASQLIVMGDFNDHPGSQPLSLLQAQGLYSAMSLVERPSRYSYLFHGLSQTLDDVLYAFQLPLIPTRAGAAHVNADYPAALAGQGDTCLRSSDHDPLFIDFGLASAAVFLPLVRR